MASIVHRAVESAYRQSPCLRVRLGKGTLVRAFEIRPVPGAHAWHSWVEREDGPRHALFFTLSQALAARASYEREVAACLANGWQIVEPS